MRITYVKFEQVGPVYRKSWLSKADFTWPILISHKVCWFSYYDVTWLIVRTWLRTCESSLYYDWLMVSWLKIVKSYDVFIFTHDSYYESWVSRIWLIWAHDLVYRFWLVKGCAQLTQTSQLRDFTLWLTMSQRCYVTWGHESPELGVWEDAYRTSFVLTKRYTTNHLSYTSGDSNLNTMRNHRPLVLSPLFW